ncbi:hypothetical protein FOA52_008092 [Chlamydomonas sp. UWO 241]|nr:hypothetical protein FOA52_008092 [Chlamydomonas sp. UWO 241]
MRLHEECVSWPGKHEQCGAVDNAAPPMLSQMQLFMMSRPPAVGSPSRGHSDDEPRASRVRRVKQEQSLSDHGGYPNPRSATALPHAWGVLPGGSSSTGEAPAFSLGRAPPPGESERLSDPVGRTAGGGGTPRKATRARSQRTPAYEQQRRSTGVARGVPRSAGTGAAGVVSDTELGMRHSAVCCVADGCMRPAQYGADGARELCADHMLPAVGLGGMGDGAGGAATAAQARRRMCMHVGCTKQAKTSAEGVFAYCKGHMSEHGVHARSTCKRCAADGCERFAKKNLADGSWMYCKAHIRASVPAPPPSGRPAKAPAVTKRCEVAQCDKHAKRSQGGCVRYCKAHMKDFDLVPQESHPHCQHPACERYAKASTEGVWRYCKAHMQQYGMWPRDYKNGPGGRSLTAAALQAQVHMAAQAAAAVAASRGHPQYSSPAGLLATPWDTLGLSSQLLGFSSQGDTGMGAGAGQGLGLGHGMPCAAAPGTFGAGSRSHPWAVSGLSAGLHSAHAHAAATGAGGSGRHSEPGSLGRLGSIDSNIQPLLYRSNPPPPPLKGSGSGREGSYDLDALLLRTASDLGDDAIGALQLKEEEREEQMADAHQAIKQEYDLPHLMMQRMHASPAGARLPSMAPPPRDTSEHHSMHMHHHHDVMGPHAQQQQQQQQFPQQWLQPQQHQQPHESPFGPRPPDVPISAAVPISMGANGRGAHPFAPRATRADGVTQQEQGLQPHHFMRADSLGSLHSFARPGGGMMHEDSVGQQLQALLAGPSVGSMGSLGVTVGGLGLSMNVGSLGMGMGMGSLGLGGAGMGSLGMGMGMSVDVGSLGLGMGSLGMGMGGGLGGASTSHLMLSEGNESDDQGDGNSTNRSAQRPLTAAASGLAAPMRPASAPPLGYAGTSSGVGFGGMHSVAVPVCSLAPPPMDDDAMRSSTPQLMLLGEGLDPAEESSGLWPQCGGGYRPYEAGGRTSATTSGRSDTHGMNMPRQDFSNLPPFDKNFYLEHPAVTARSDEEVAAYRAKREIHVNGPGVPKPCTTFDEASFPSYVLAEVLKAGFGAPTPIQAQGWPMALQGRDLIGLAETGSGKTLAYVLPAVVHINAQPYLAVLGWVTE